MKQIPIAEATAAQLREFARDALGLPDIKDTANKAQLLAQIQAAWDKPHIVVSVVDESLPARRTAKAAIAEETPDNHPEKVTVLIHVQEEKGGDRPVELSVNGKIMLVPRGVEAEIPWPYYIALKHAEQHFYDPLPVNDQESGGLNPEPRKVMRYPFSRVA